MGLDKLSKQGVLPLHIAGAVVCSVLLIMGWFVGVSPILAESNQGETIVRQAMKAEREAQQAKHELDKLTKSLDKVREQLEHQPVSLATATEINPLLAQLASWADEHHLAITQTQAKRPQSMRHYDYIPIQISGEGGYANLLAFFNQLHKDRGDLGILGFSIRRIQTKDGPGVGFDLQLAWYVVGEQQQEESATGPATASVPLGGLRGE